MRTPHFWDYALKNTQQAVLSVLCHGGVLGEGGSSKGVHYEGKTSIWTSGLHWGLTHQAVTVATLLDLSITPVSPTAEAVTTLCSWRSTTAHSHLLTRSAVNAALSLTMESLKCWEGSTCPGAFCLFQTDSSTLVSLVSTAQLEDNVYPVYRVSRVHRVCSVQQAQ